MTANHEHTPDTQEMLKKYIYQGGTLEEFYRWLDGVCMHYQQLGFSEGVDHASEGHAAEVAAAERRGAARELRKFAHAQDTWCEEGRAEQRISRIAMRDALLDRADLLEGDDA